MEIRRRALAVAALLSTAVAPLAARADGQRDLEDGIAFYENLDVERAAERLEAAVAAPDLSDGDRARAYLYLGMIRFETGREAEAETEWLRALALDPQVAPPPGTSPKTIAALDAARARASVAPPPELPKVVPKTEPPASPEPPILPAEAEEDSGGGIGWYWWAGIGAVAVGATIVAVVLATSGGSECSLPGGCATLRLR